MTTIAAIRRIRKIPTVKITIIVTEKKNVDFIHSLAMYSNNYFRSVKLTFQINLAFFTSKPGIADAFHLFSNWIEMAFAVAVTFVTILIFSYNRNEKNINYT